MKITAQISELHTDISIYATEELGSEGDNFYRK